MCDRNKHDIRNSRGRPSGKKHPVLGLNPTPRIALSVRWSVFPLSNGHTHPSNVWAYTLMHGSYGLSRTKSSLRAPTLRVVVSLGDHSLTRLTRVKRKVVAPESVTWSDQCVAGENERGTAAARWAGWCSSTWLAPWLPLDEKRLADMSSFATFYTFTHSHFQAITLYHNCKL